MMQVTSGAGIHGSWRWSNVSVCYTDDDDASLSSPWSPQPSPTSPSHWVYHHSFMATTTTTSSVSPRRPCQPTRTNTNSSITQHRRDPDITNRMHKYFVKSTLKKFSIDDRIILVDYWNLIKFCLLLHCFVNLLKKQEISRACTKWWWFFFWFFSNFPFLNDYDSDVHILKPGTNIVISSRPC